MHIAIDALARRVIIIRHSFQSEYLLINSITKTLIPIFTTKQPFS